MRSFRTVIVAAATLGCHGAPVEVDAITLDTRVDVASATLSASAPADSLRVTVSVTNPSSRQAVVTLGGPPYHFGTIPAAETQGIGFGVRVLRSDSAGSGGPTAWTWGQPTFTFGPWETRRHTFVFAVGTDPAAQGAVLPGPGTYRIIASFGRREAAPLLITVRR
jgi:hypothetical protein